VVNGQSFILIRQLMALARRALAEVCIVPVLLVLFVFCCLSSSALWLYLHSVVSTQVFEKFISFLKQREKVHIC